MAEAYIFDTVRTPRGRGKSDGSLHEVQPVTLLSILLKALKERNHLDTSLVDDVILGCVSPVMEQGANIARTAVLESGFSQTVGGVQMNRFCASGLEAINTAAAHVIAGQYDFVVAGGVESMSRIPMGSDGGAMFTSPDIIARHKIVPQGISADLIATVNSYSRQEADAFAVESHRRAVEAQKAGKFDKSIIPVLDILGNLILGHDEGVREGTSVESLAKLMASFEMMGLMGGLDALALQKYPTLSKISHIHHAGNSSQIVDGAGLVLIGSKEAGQKAGLKPRAKIHSYAVVGSEPTIMLTAPAPSTHKLLKRNGMKISDIDLFEVNEAFAVVPMLYMQETGATPDKVNVNGGSIALGHPLGATGAIILGTLLDELERQDKNLGLATLCIGGGMGVSTIIERV
ncbi:MAG: acetyl-CoA C-acetyltransferase [Cytophagia bacterium]|nr:MAG: acetyl-CoA C-acetyltransferase [Cytophagales bacterium]TAG05291.1 MAG: acetyl-CoA C-acetyltransferase [Cytophagia bacterium]TAG43450.1 MAG: acetyl-CoA C-acetyltransferase [Cytophagia bacterium]TAH28707.1 MAG: acetyl-CoA C-acetyltransferase [Cytophagales bacterium]